MSRRAQPLPDIVGPDCRILFVGINPSLRSAALGHHYAGHGNRFWKLLYASGLIPEPFTFLDDARLPQLGYGSTNIIDRATASADELGPRDYELGRVSLRRKISAWRPEIVAFIGVVVYRAFFQVKGAVTCGAHDSEHVGVSEIFVLPNPSGRNAHYPYPRMLELYAQLAERVRPSPDIRRSPRARPAGSRARPEPRTPGRR